MSARQKSVMMVVAAIVVLSGAVAQAELIHRWSFDGNANDSVGTANASLAGTASISGGQLVLDGGGYATTSNLPEELHSRTLVTWVSLSSLGQDMGVFGVQNHGQFAQFDAIAYGERTANQWMNGSNGWSRTLADNGGALETSTGKIMMAIVYDANGAETGLGSISLYRNGTLYADGGAFNTSPYPFSADTAYAVLGSRWVSDTWGAQAKLNGSIDEARIYNTALSAGQISQLNAWGPNQVVPEPGTLALVGTALFGLLAYAWRRRK